MIKLCSNEIYLIPSKRQFQIVNKGWWLSGRQQQKKKLRKTSVRSSAIPSSRIREKLFHILRVWQTINCDSANHFSDDHRRCDGAHILAITSLIHSPSRRHLFSIYCLSRLCLVIWSYSWMSALKEEKKKNKIVMNKMTPNMTGKNKNRRIYFVLKLAYVSFRV